MNGMMNLAYSLLAFDRLSINNKRFIKNNFNYFEHTPASLALSEFTFLNSHVSGIQGLLYGLDKSYTLSRSNEDFDKLYNHLKRLFRSVPFRTDFVYGSPSTRRLEGNSSSILLERARSLNELAQEYSQNLYFEALPLSYCDFINTHEELLAINPRIHVDTATLISQGLGASWIGANFNHIDRIHLSIPGYSSSFRNYDSFFGELANQLRFFEGKVIIEVQDVDEKFKEDIKWLCDQF
jgi:hypothetical protein